MSSHWKDWMDFTHSERNGFLLLIPIVVIGAFLPKLYPYLISKEPTDFSKIEKVLAAIEEERKLDSIAEVKLKATEKLAKQKADSLKAEPFPFDPNNVEFDDLLKLGFSKKLAHTIENYRDKGGKFYEKEDLRKIYGLSDSLYQNLESFIEIPDEKFAKKDEKQWANKRKFKNDKKTTKEPLAIEINSTDSLELIKIKGIGPAFSSLILKYKNLLGGYRSKDQLLEVYGMDSSRWEKLIPHIYIDTSNVSKIPINEAEWIDLVRHPYIDKSTANNIVNHREYNGYFEKVSDIKTYYLVNKRLYRKIAPYLVVDDRTEAKKPD